MGSTFQHIKKFACSIGKSFGTARLVILPKESHGYRAKESILHVLWEQDVWLDKYVKYKTEAVPVSSE